MAATLTKVTGDFLSFCISALMRVGANAVPSRHTSEFVLHLQLLEMIYFVALCMFNFASDSDRLFVALDTQHTAAATRLAPWTSIPNDTHNLVSLVGL